MYNRINVAEKVHFGVPYAPGLMNVGSHTLLIYFEFTLVCL